ncbi:MAG TPA: AraC family transcriptional regulator [Candidatus Eisenbergiella intestinipullorum]|nr:AraC family transcriptional regulator [Candidatus Eisenbergiella intestinipullorum]
MVDQYLTAFYGRELEDENAGWEFVYSINNEPHNDREFCLHNHNDLYEIYLFLEGDLEFHIEGSVYPAHPYDIFIARPCEMHHNFFLSPSRYRRIVVFVPVKFFRQNHCEELEDFFLRRSLGADCQIPASIARQELAPLLLKINRYLQEGALKIAKYVLLEFLYQLGQIREPLAEPVVEDQRIRNILLWLNDHLAERITLDQLAETFFLNKYHLCRIFRSVTGMSINRYLNYKRLLMARTLHQNGQTFLEASVNAGFNSYAHFYRMHRQVFGCGPREEDSRTVTPAAAPSHHSR